MVGRSGGRKKGNKPSGQIGWWLAIVAALAVLGAFGWFYVSIVSKPQPDKVTLCPAEGPSGAIVVVLDLTDPVSERQAAAIERTIRGEVDAASPGTMISLGRVTGDGSAAAPFHVCKPRSGADANQVYENPGQIAARYAEAFEKPFGAAVQMMMTAPKEDHSPIMEAVQATVLATPDYDRTTGAKKLILVSDLLQNSDVFSLYRKDTWEKFEASPDFARLSHNLGGAEVVALRIPREEGSEAMVAEAKTFWTGYFDREGAVSVSFDTVGDL